MEDPFFHLSEARTPSKAPRYRISIIIAILSIISATLAIVTRIPILALIGLLGALAISNGGAPKRRDHVQAAANFYSYVVVLLPYRSSGASGSSRTTNVMRDDILSAKIIREPFSGTVDAAMPGAPTGIMFLLKSKMAGTSFSLINRDPEEILQLVKKLREVWGINVSDPADSVTKLQDLVGKYVVNDTGSGISMVKSIFYALSFLFIMTYSILFLIFGIIANVLLLYLLALLIISLPIAYSYLRDKNAYDGIKTVIVEEKGLSVNFGRDRSGSFTWDSIMMISPAKLTVQTDGIFQHLGLISLKGEHWNYYMSQEMTDTLIAAYELATGRAPPVKRKLFAR